MRTLTAAALAALALGAGTAHASPHSGVNAQLYRPSLDTFGVLSLEGARGLHDKDFSLKLSLGFGQDPLQVAVPGIGGDEEGDSVLKRIIALDITAAFALTERLSVGFDVGMVRTDTDDGYGRRGLYRAGGSDPSTGLISLRPLSNIAPSENLEAQAHVVPLDARVGAKYRLLTGDLGIALVGIVSAPFGDEEMFLGDAGFVFEPRLAVDYALGKQSRVVFNAGARFRKRTVLEAFDPMTQAAADAQAVLDIGSEALVGLGMVYEVAPQLLLAAEATYLHPLPASLSWGTCTRFNGDDCDEMTDDAYFADGEYGDPAAYALAGVQYRASPDVTLAVTGGSAGLIGDGRGETFRVMAGVLWQPAPEGTKVIGTGDADGDEVPDALDICPDEPEDRDDYQDDDGCPDLDNDGDGVIDAQDQCPDEPEDRDGFEDEDGCPERDNDGDGIADVTDRCPSDAEDMDQFEDGDGCPDEDNDGDGIADAKDKCPNEAETVNGVDDTDGCPDETVAGGPQMDLRAVDLRGGRIEFARNNRLTRPSRELLDDVASLLNEPQWRDVRIRVEVHVPLGTSSSNRRTIQRQQLRDRRTAQERAQEIVDYLVSKGISPDRVQPAGIGSAVPLNPRAPTDSQNERVEFIRTEQQ